MEDLERIETLVYKRFNPEEICYIRKTISNNYEVMFGYGYIDYIHFVKDTRNDWHVTINLDFQITSSGGYTKSIEEALDSAMEILEEKVKIINDICYNYKERKNKYKGE